MDDWNASLAFVRQFAVQYMDVEGPVAVSSAAANERLEARITSEQKELFKEAATLQGVTLTDFIVSSVHQAAIRTLEKRHIIEISRNDQKAFVDALLHPAPPNARLREAWSRHHQTGKKSAVVASRTRTSRAR